MKIFFYIWEYKCFSLIITFLLMFQVVFNFVIPYCSSMTIDVGIQQQGIENSVPNSMNDDIYQKLMSFDSQNIIKDSYTKESNCNMYSLNELGKKNKKELDLVMRGPVAYIASEDYIDNSTNEDLNLYIDKYDSNMIRQKAIASNRNIMIDAGVDVDQSQMDYLFYWGIIMFLISFLAVLLSFSSNVLITIISLRIATKMRNKLFISIMGFSSVDINKFSESSLITRCTNDIQNLQGFCGLFLRIILYAPICIVVGFVFAVVTCAQLSWIIIAVAIGIIVFAFLLRHFLIKYFRKVQKLLDKVNLHAREMLSGILVNRAFNKARYEENLFDSANSQLYKYQLITGRITSLIAPIMGFGTTCISIFSILLGGFYVSVGSLQVGAIVAFTAYSGIIISAFADVGLLLGKIPQASVTINRLEKVINHKAYFDGENTKGKKIQSLRSTTSKNIIKFNNVYYSYNNSKTYAIKNLSFSLKEGDTLGIIGTLGSGKSTILQLLLRLCDVTKGSITFNGVNIKDIDLLEYRSLFSLAPQQSFLFSGTVKSNVSYGVDGQFKDDNDYLMKYIKIAQADDFVNESNENKGLNISISQDSVNISGGQRQRLSIARALAANKPILIFDDCFSALDYAVEKKLREKLNIYAKNKTKIIVSSRLSNILHVDNIMVMHEGNMVGMGSHEYLMKHCSEYIKIAKSQLDELSTIEGSVKSD